MNFSITEERRSNEQGERVTRFVVYADNELVEIFNTRAFAEGWINRQRKNLGLPPIKRASKRYRITQDLLPDVPGDEPPWRVVDEDGECHGLFDTKEQAEAWLAVKFKATPVQSRSLRERVQTPEEAIQGRIKVLEDARDRLDDQVQNATARLEWLLEQIEMAETRLLQIEEKLPTRIKAGKRVIEL